MSKAQQKPVVICLMGPTASGKTDLAIAVAQHAPIDLISVDSAQVYRGMDIGSGKPDPELLASYPHRLIDIRDPVQPYSASDFRRDALNEIDAVVGAGKIPFLVGGTMLYFKALRDGLADMPMADPKVRRDIERLAEESGWEAVHQRLTAVDPEAAQRIHPNDPQRLQRALEVYLLTGKSLSDHHREEKSFRHGPNRELPFRLVYFASQVDDRAVLHARIAQRFQHMLERGLLEEVQELFDRGDLGTSLPSIKSVGYRQVWKYLEGQLDYDGMVEKSIIATRQLAKRQLTWLRNWPDLRALSESPANSIDSILNYMDSISI